MTSPSPPTPTFPTLKPLPRATVQTILPNQLYILDLLPPSQTSKLLAWCQAQTLQGPVAAKKGEAERTARRAALQSTDIATSLLSLLASHLQSLEPCPKNPILSPNIRVYHYPPGTYFRGHYDTPQLDPASRRLSCWTVLVYLGECTGGGTSFHPHGTSSTKAGAKKRGKKEEKQESSKDKITVEPKAGRVLLHWHGVAAGGCMLHEGDEVISGDKHRDVLLLMLLVSSAVCINIQCRMIHAVLIFNNHGKPRLSKFFTLIPPLVQQSLISQIFSLISDRPQGVCNFLDAPELVFPTPGLSREQEALNKDKKDKERRNGNGNGKLKLIGGDDDTRVIYRHYATLYFVFVVDGAESELGILDLIQVFVESLDRAFENVCELDLIFHFDEVHYVLGEIIQGGLVLETNINEISACVQASSRNRKASAASANPLIPSALASNASSAGRVFARGGSADGPRKWLAAMGV